MGSILQDVKKAGYNGIEWYPYAVQEDYKAVVKLLEKYKLNFMIVMTVLGQTETFDIYLESLEKQLLDLSAIQTTNKQPVQISAQTGREFLTKKQVDACLLCCKKVSNATGIPIHQETHRNKWAYVAHEVYAQLKKHPDLTLTLDISHWFCVSESYLHDQQVAVDPAIQHTKHIHARVGHTQGPQVWQPAAAEYAEALNEHLQIWDKWMRHMKQIGVARCTITPEFGPPPYTVFANREGTPFDEQWRLNLWMKDLLQQRFADL